MSPIDQCAVAFTRRGVDFAHHLELHYAHGFVFSTPAFFIMGRPVDRHASATFIRDPKYKEAEGKCNAWWIHGMAGDVAKAWDILPWPMAWIGFERFDNDLRFYSAEDIRRLTIPTNEMATSA